MKTYFCNDCEVLRSSERPADRDSSMCIAFDAETAQQIASSLRACIGIPDPEVTIPALVEAAKDLQGFLEPYSKLKQYPSHQAALERVRSILSKLQPSD